MKIFKEERKLKVSSSVVIKLLSDDDSLPTKK